MGFFSRKQQPAAPRYTASEDNVEVQPDPKSLVVCRNHPACRVITEYRLSRDGYCTHCLPREVADEVMDAAMRFKCCGQNPCICGKMWH